MIYVLIEQEHDYDYCHHKLIFAHSDRNEVEEVKKRCEAHKARAMEASNVLKQELNKWKLDNPHPILSSYNIEYNANFHKWSSDRYQFDRDKSIALKEWFNLRSIDTISELGDGAMQYFIEEVPDDASIY